MAVCAVKRYQKDLKSQETSVSSEKVCQKFGK
jgi:hypothetical protein